MFAKRLNYAKGQINKCNHKMPGRKQKWKNPQFCSEVVAADLRDAIGASGSCQKWFRTEKPIKRAALGVSKIQTADAWMRSALFPSKSKKGFGRWTTTIWLDELQEILWAEKERETASHAEQAEVIQRPQRDGKSVGLRARKIKS